MSDHAEELFRLLKESAVSRTLRKAVFSGPRPGEQSFVRVDVRPVEVQGRWMLQFTSQTATQQFHQNRDGEAAAGELSRLAKDVFRNIHVVTDSGLYEGRFSRRGKCFLRREEASAAVSRPPLPAHNRTPNHLIPEGTPCPFLIHTGVMTKDGTVRTSHFRKFRQINRFLEFIQDVSDLLPSDRTIRVVDFGCGKSYLTFATHYLFTTLLRRDCQIMGLDRRPDVVRTCSTIADELGLENLKFSVGDISGYQSDVAADLVISLHACDTATDEALIQALRWRSRVILAVPCCQHECNQYLSDSALSPLTTYGLTKERFASLATDSMRAALLTAAGYQTQVLEFIDTEHTPKNILIRSVRMSDRGGSDAATKAHADVLGLRSQLGIPPLTLERRLVECGLLASPP